MGGPFSASLSECVCVLNHLHCLQRAWPLQCNLSNETCRRLQSELGGELAAAHRFILSTFLVYGSSYSAKSLIDCLY